MSRPPLLFLFAVLVRTSNAMADRYRFTGLTGTGIPAYRLGRGSSSGLGYTQVRGLPETGFTQVQVQVQVTGTADNRLPQEPPDTQDQFERCIFDEQVQKGAQKM